MDTNEELRRIEREMLDIKPDDVFTIEEKRRMLGFMANREWAQLGYFIMQRAMEQPARPEQHAAFLQYHHAMPGRVLEEIEAAGHAVGYRGLFQLADHLFRGARMLWTTWCTADDSEPSPTGPPAGT